MFACETQSDTSMMRLAYQSCKHMPQLEIIGVAKAFFKTWKFGGYPLEQSTGTTWSPHIVDVGRSLKRMKSCKKWSKLKSSQMQAFFTVLLLLISLKANQITPKPSCTWSRCRNWNWIFQELYTKTLWRSFWKQKTWPMHKNGCVVFKRLALSLL